MHDEPARDLTTFTTAQFFRRPRTMAIFVFFFVSLVLFRLCLVAMIRLNAATIGDYEFHWWGMAMAVKTRELLNNMRGQG